MKKSRQRLNKFGDLFRTINILRDQIKHLRYKSTKLIKIVKSGELTNFLAIFLKIEQES